MNIQLTEGQALVLAGPQGSLKSTKAREIAAKYGTYIETTAFALSQRRELNSILLQRPDVLIVEGLPETTAQWIETKILLSTRATAVREPYKTIIRHCIHPHLIFCTNDAHVTLFQELKDTDRRFRIVYMKLPIGQRVRNLIRQFKRRVKTLSPTQWWFRIRATYWMHRQLRPTWSFMECYHYADTFELEDWDGFSPKDAVLEEISNWSD